MQLPAEWDRQQLVLLTFPRRDGDWGKALHQASLAMAKAATRISEVTPVLLIVSDEEHFENYREVYTGETITLPTNDCWIRDYGPLCTWFEEDTLVLNHFTFNGWGGKFTATWDDGVTQRLWRAVFPNAGYRRSELILEGGSVESDGNGTLLTTTRCWLSEGRNDWKTKAEAETAIAAFFEFDRVLWLDHGELAGDDTDAHVDTLVRFLDENTLAYVQCTDEKDEHYADLQKMEAELRAFRTPHGKPYTLLPLPLPPPVFSLDDGHRLPATYANFLLSNGVLFLPTYFDQEGKTHPGKIADHLAAQTLREYGRYQVVPINCRPFIEQHGSLHCLTMQIPG